MVVKINLKTRHSFPQRKGTIRHYVTKSLFVNYVYVTGLNTRTLKNFTDRSLMLNSRQKKYCICSGNLLDRAVRYAAG